MRSSKWLMCQINTEAKGLFHSWTCPYKVEIIAIITSNFLN